MDNYEKMQVVGRGAFGIVYLCQRLTDKKHVIIKQIPVEQMTKDERIAALNEVKVLSMLDHPNIIRYYENFLEDKALMIVMEYAQGGTLFQYLQQRNGQLLDEQEILKFFTQLLLSLHHVHSKQILHRDLKTENILLDFKKETVKIGDFGISKLLLSKSKAYTVVGTPCYISPELCEGKPYNQKSDIWALGCVLYEMTTLRRAFEAQTLPALILKIMRGTFVPVPDRYCEGLHQLIVNMLQLDPSKRPTINQIMAQPLVLDFVLALFTDFGKIACRRVLHPVSGMSGRGHIARSTAVGSTVLNHGHGEASCTQPRVSRVFCWGSGLMTPTLLPLPTSDTHIVAVSTGRIQKAAVTKNGRLLLWENHVTMPENSTKTGCTSVGFIPRFLEGQSAVCIQQVSCGDLFTACITDRGILMTFGSGAYGCLGHGNFSDVTQARIVEALLGFEVTTVSCGTSHILAITNDQEVFAWGRGDNGRLGLGNRTTFCLPQLVPNVSDKLPVRVACGVDCSLILCHSGRLLASGSNRYNKLALNESVDEVEVFEPTATFPVSQLYIISAALGTSHTAVTTVEGKCYTFGSNQFGQLGCTLSMAAGVHSVTDLDAYDIATVACGDTFTIAVSKGGHVFSWGKNSRGRLGHRSQLEHVPAMITLENQQQVDVISVSCSHATTLLCSSYFQAANNNRTLASK